MLHLRAILGVDAQQNFSARLATIQSFAGSLRKLGVETIIHALPDDSLCLVVGKHYFWLPRRNFFNDPFWATWLADTANASNVWLSQVSLSDSSSYFLILAPFTFTHLASSSSPGIIAFKVALPPLLKNFTDQIKLDHEPGMFASVISGAGYGKIIRRFPAFAVTLRNASCPNSKRES